METPGALLPVGQIRMHEQLEYVPVVRHEQVRQFMPDREFGSRIRPGFGAGPADRDEVLELWRVGGAPDGAGGIPEPGLQGRDIEMLGIRRQEG